MATSRREMQEHVIVLDMFRNLFEISWPSSIVSSKARDFASTLNICVQDISNVCLLRFEALKTLRRLGLSYRRSVVKVRPWCIW